MSFLFMNKEHLLLSMHYRQEDLMRKVAKLEGWKEEVRQRIVKKEKEAQEAKVGFFFCSISFSNLYCL